MRLTGTTPYMLPWMSRELQQLDDVLGPDPWPYGVEACRRTLEAFTTYLFEQGMTKKIVPLEQLFVCGADESKN